jgi:large subunit ribosomal protein L23
LAVPEAPNFQTEPPSRVCQSDLPLLKSPKTPPLSARCVVSLDFVSFGCGILKKSVRKTFISFRSLFNNQITISLQAITHATYTTVIIIIMLAQVTKQFRMWMPNMPMILVSARNATARQPARATFRVLPRMTKHEIKEYLTKIYNLPVQKVNTSNYLGKRKLVRGSTQVIRYKYRDFKKAIVSFDRSFTNVGIGLRIPEIDDDGELPAESKT